MYQPSIDWNPKQQKMREQLRKPDGFLEGMRICRQLHAFLHEGHASGAKNPTLMDQVLEGIREEDYTIVI